MGKTAIEQWLRRQKHASAQAQLKTVAYVEDWSERKILDDRAWEWGSITDKTELTNRKLVTEKAFLLRILVRQGRSVEIRTSRCDAWPASWESSAIGAVA